MPKKDAWISWEWRGHSPTFVHTLTLVPAKPAASGSSSIPHESIEASGADVRPSLPPTQADIPHLCCYN